MPIFRAIRLANDQVWLDLDVVPLITGGMDANGEPDFVNVVSAIAWANNTSQPARFWLRRASDGTILREEIIPPQTSGNRNIVGNQAARTNPSVGGQWPA